jgi:hypothetical protein
MLDNARHWLALTLIEIALFVIMPDGRKRTMWLIAAHEALA